MKKLILTFVVVCAYFVAQSQVTFTDDNLLDVVENTDKLILIDFYADWCGPCKRMHPILRSIADDYYGKVIVGRMNRP